MSWPVVSPRDWGIRPPGGDSCLYCKQKVWEPHGPECVVVTKLVSLEVTIETDDGPLMGEYHYISPHYWTAENIEFKWNESSSCASNIFSDWDEIRWYGESGPERAAKFYAEWPDEDESHVCLCGRMKVKYLHDLSQKAFIAEE